MASDTIYGLFENAKKDRDRYKSLYLAEKARREAGDARWKAAEKALNTIHKYEDGKSTINGMDINAWIEWIAAIAAHEKVMREVGE